MNSVILAAVGLLLVSAAPAFSRKNLWNEEDYNEVLKGYNMKEDLEMDRLLEKGVNSWHSSGGGDWSTTEAASTMYSSFSIDWASSYVDTNIGIGSADLIGAQTGELMIVESYVSTYIYSYMHTWASSGAVTRPDGKVSHWTSRYTTYWTSTFTSSFTEQEVVSTFSSEWTKCDSGVSTWVQTYNNQIWNSGSEITGDHEWDSSFSTSTSESWASSWESSWQSTYKGGRVSSWYSATTSLSTNGEVQIETSSWSQGFNLDRKKK